MKVTEEICKAFLEAQNSALNEGHGGGAYAHGLQAVLDLIEKEQRGFGVQSDRDDTVPELQCLLDDDCPWCTEVSGDPQLGWTTIADLAQVAAEHAAEVHR